MNFNAIFIGAETIFCPLGNDVDTTWQKMLRGETGIQLFEKKGWNASDVYLSLLEGNFTSKFKEIVHQVMVDSLQKLWDPNLISSEDTLVVISSTKGDLEADINKPFAAISTFLITTFQLKNTPLIISNACVSGILAIVKAADLLKINRYKHIIVVGADVVTDFILCGFQSLFAVSALPCKPFDKSRKGVTLGEGAASVVLSRDQSIFQENPVLYLGGTSSNDANHISGPSRTGEGLVRSITRTLTQANVTIDQLDYISAHGTGTIFNDEMESIALGRLQLSDVPVNSLKGYFGHTLGAAGVIETVFAMKSIRTNTLLASKGFEQQGTSEQINVLQSNQAKPVSTVLKTASGFGGCNASLLLECQ